MSIFIEYINNLSNNYGTLKISSDSQYINYKLNFSKNINKYKYLFINEECVSPTKFIESINLDNDWKLMCRIDKLTETYTEINYISSEKIIKLSVISDIEIGSEFIIIVNNDIFTQFQLAITNIFNNCI